MLVKKVSFYDFLKEFEKFGREDQFSDKGKKALFDYLNELAEDLFCRGSFRENCIKNNSQSGANTNTRHKKGGRKMKVRIENFEIEVLEKEKLENIISNLDRDKVAEKLLKLADGYEFTGTAYIYIDAETGKLEEGWIQQGTSLHPADRITKIVLMDEPTPFRWEDVLDEDVIDPTSQEWSEFENWKEKQEWDTDVFTFLEEKYGKEGLEERKSLIYEGFIDNMEWRDDIGEQLDALYSMIEK